MCSDGSGYIGVDGRELMEMGGEGNGRRYIHIHIHIHTSTLYIYIHIHSISSIHIAMHCSSRSTPIILAMFGFTLVVAIMIRNIYRITADEFAAVIQLNKVLKMEDCLLLHQFLGHDLYLSLIHI